jgi:hypothetical protein
VRIARRLGVAIAALVARVRQTLVPRKKFRTAAISCGKCYVSNLDNTAEVLAAAEGESFK